MYFWFLSFGAGYSRSETSGALLAVFDDLDVRSYAVWEMLGAFDVLACVYLEPSREQEFQSELVRRLASLGLMKDQPFFVENVIRDWIWGSSSPSDVVRWPDRKVLRSHFPQRELELVSGSGESQLRRDLIQRYSELGLLTEATHSYGIELVIFVGSMEQLTYRTQHVVGRRLAKVLDQAGDLVHDCSLFQGRGGQRELFLIRCRVDHTDFHRIAEGLLEPIRAATALGDGVVTAYPVVSDDAILYQDQIALKPQAKADASALLRAGENRSVDVRPTLLTPLDPWLKGDEPLKERREYANRAVLPTIVALLNSGGGSVVIGAVEQARYRERPEVLARLGDPPSLGDYWVIGLLDPTYVEHGWDAWHKRLHDLLGYIDPNPGVLIQARLEGVLGREVCVIDVDDPGDTAFFLRQRGEGATYYARQGGASRELQGAMIDEHRNRTRRLQELHSRSS